MHIIGQEKIFLLIKSEITQVTTFVDTSVNQRNRFLHLGLNHLNPPSIDRKLTRKCKLGKNTKCSKGTRGCRLKYMQAMATMDYSFVALQFLPFNVSKGFLIYHSKGVMEGQIRAILRNMEGQKPSDSGTNEGKLQKYLDLCTHPDVRGFKVNTYVYTR